MSELDHKSRAHSEIGASGASRWVNCPASVMASRGIEDSTSVFAEAGTAAHELSEHCMAEGVDPFTMVGEKINDRLIDEEMAEAAKIYLTEVAKYIESDEYEVHIEERFELVHIHKDMFGSNDFCAIKDNHLVIVDFKYGKGVPVSARDNLQLIYYAIGAVEKYKDFYSIDEITMAICQPRVGNNWDEWTIRAEDLPIYEKMFSKAVANAYSDKPQYQSGDHCKWCKAKATCPALKTEVEATIEAKFEAEPATLPDPTKLDPETISKILNKEKLITDWLKAVSTHAKNEIERGVSIPDYKLVASRVNRKIKEDDLVKDFGEMDIYDKKLKTIAKLEKIVGKKELANYTYKPEAGVTIAHVSDKRQEVIGSVDKAFLEADDKSNDDFDNMDF